MAPKVLLASRLRKEDDPTAREAARLTERLGGELIVLYVAAELTTVPQLEAAGENPEELRRRMLDGIEDEVRDYLHRNLPNRAVRVRVVEGDVAEQVAKVAAEERVDYLVIGAHGRSVLSHLILGSTSQAILKHALCPVLVVPEVPS